MIKQKFHFKDNCFLTIYHDTSEIFSNNYFRTAKKTLGDDELIFEEIYLEGIKNEQIEYDLVLNGFLKHEHPKNPYSSLCCNYKEFINYEKFLIENGQVNNLNLFNSISEFVEEWSGFKLKLNPYCLSNILVFTTTQILPSLRLNKDNPNKIDFNFKFMNVPKFKIIIKFKLDSVITDTKIYDESISIAETIHEWNNIDYDIFENEKLIYSDANSYFIRSININMGIISKTIDVKLKTDNNKTVKLESVFYNPAIVGEKEKSELMNYIYLEKLINIPSAEEKLFRFLKKNENELAFNTFQEIAKSKDYEELWIFDPYFTDLNTEGGKDKILDILTILSTNLDINKNIVFECKQLVNLIVKSGIINFIMILEKTK